ncbi:hypothetical protein [Phaeobacter inhibens]|uniref:hypothetical protein n=1 Tax=Phaeobacter inhibens TaxID=221822 RepID=UPI00295E3D31|nr:hypothetical protein [Phaeobacter inhibens]
MTKNALIAAFAMAVAVFGSAVGGQVEGFAFPVADATVFDDVAPAGPTHVRITGHSVKLRDCTFTGIEFRTQTGTVAAVTFEEGTRDREAGVFDFGPWLVQLTPEQLETATVVVFHRCHPLWATETRWYP